jgi:hypothetical protein
VPIRGDHSLCLANGPAASHIFNLQRAALARRQITVQTHWMVRASLEPMSHIETAALESVAR